MEKILSNIVLKNTELTGVLGREKFDVLADVLGEAAWKEYRELYEAAASLKVVTDYPVQLDFELNASCNLKCPMCPISAESAKGKGRKTWFSFDLYKEIVSAGVVRGLRAIKLNYINEPLIRDDLPAFVEFARKAGVLDVYMSTNGLLLDEEMAHELIKAGMTRIQISLDAHTSETYDQVRPGGDFHKVVSYVQQLVRIRDTLKSITPLIRVNFVRTELNEHELNQFVEFWRPKVDMIGIQEYIKPPIASGEIGSRTTQDKKQRGFKCSFPYKQLVITNEKNILPCCTFWGEHLPLGKCTGPDSIITAWRSEKMESLRRIHAAGEYWKMEACRQCVEGGKLE
jgi:radical SAM protein with 4Fe4S-binding SPASM domain